LIEMETVPAHNGGSRAFARAHIVTRLCSGVSAGELLPGSPGDVGGDDVRSMPVQGCPGPVVSHGGTRVSVRGGFLHVAQRHPRIQRRGDKCVPERMRPDDLGNPGPAGDPADDPPGAIRIWLWHKDRDAVAYSYVRLGTW
jgi:hypothetical protein